MQDRLRLEEGGGHRWKVGNLRRFEKNQHFKILRKRFNFGVKTTAKSNFYFNFQAKSFFSKLFCRPRYLVR